MRNIEDHAEALVVSSDSLFTGKHTLKAASKKNIRTDFCRQDMETKKREKTEDNIRECFEDLNRNVK